MSHMELVVVKHVVLLSGVFLSWALSVVSSGQGNTPSLAGNWKITVLPRGAHLTLWLVQIRETQGKLQASLLAAGSPEFRNTRIQEVRFDGQALRLSLEANGVTYHVVGYVPKDDPKPNRLLGSNGALGRRDLLRMERTEAKDLGTEAIQVLADPAATAFEEAFTTADPKAREAAFERIVQQFPDHPMAFHALMYLIEHCAQFDSSVETARERAELALRLGEAYGREMVLHVYVQLAHLLARSARTAPLALEYARKAEATLTDSDPLLLHARLLRALHLALRNTGDEPGARQTQERLTQINQRLDEEYQRTALPFPIEPYRGRKGASDRVVLLELFTGTQCPPCVAADLACAALLQTYSSKELLLIQYHLHLPGPDPLTCPDSMKRAAYYRVDGTPMLFLNGQEGPSVFGYRTQSRERYRTLRSMLDQRLETEPGARLQLKLQRQDQQLAVEVNYADIKRPGETLRLRVALVEGQVSYSAPNGIRLHHNVLRSFLGDSDGIALKDRSGSHSLSADLAKVRSDLAKHHEEVSKVLRFPDAEIPLDFRRLKVIAFIQDDKMQEILQAAEASVPEISEAPGPP
jgi:hypothetical protein